MPEMLSPAILNTSMPSTAGATIRIPPARAASGAYPEGAYRLAMKSAMYHF